MTLMAVVAHPDDETFGLGSVLAQAAERMPTVVVCASRGEAGELAPGIPEPAGGLGDLREAELRSAAERLGVGTVEILGLADSGMSGVAGPGTICGVLPDELVRQVADRVARHRPSVVVTLDGSDGHRDHIRIRDATVRAVDGYDVSLYLHCLPRSLMTRWLRLQGGDTAYDVPDVGTPDDDVTTVLDSGAYYPTRLAAISLHRSQTSPFDSLPEDLRRDFLATEHLIRVRPRWTGGPRETALTVGRPIGHSGL